VKFVAGVMADLILMENKECKKGVIFEPFRSTGFDFDVWGSS
jgi:hypothetical protein